VLSVPQLTKIYCFFSLQQCNHFVMQKAEKSCFVIEIDCLMAIRCCVSPEQVSPVIIVIDVAVFMLLSS